MTYLIFKRSERELRERAAEEKPAEFRRGVISGYARDIEEAAQVWRDERGRDNTGFAPMLCDDGGAADRELEQRTYKAAGLSWEEYQDGRQ